MKHLICTLVFPIIMLGPVVNAQEYIEEFDRFPAEITIDEDTYSGVLLSESDYVRYLELEIEVQTLKPQYEALKKGNDRLNESYNRLLDSHNNTINKIDKVAERSWFEINQGWLGMTLGFILGAGVVGLVVSLK